MSRLGGFLLPASYPQPETFPERVLGTMRCLCGQYHYVDEDGVVVDGVCWAEAQRKS